MKKKKLSKKLDLGKKQISNLGNVKGGARVESQIICIVQPTQDIFNCTWVSELYSACQCEPSWNGHCPTNGFLICQESVNVPCLP